MSTLKQTIQALTLALCATMAFGQGIVTNNDAVLLFGAKESCTKPATVDWKKVRGKTPEWKTIKSEGVKKGSARYSLLIADLKKRVKKHVKKVAQDKGNDCVVRKGDISDAKGLSVEDLTSAVVKALESEGDDS